MPPQPLRLLLAFLFTFGPVVAQEERRLLPENSATRIAIVVGSSATLVVDTGMGARNGAIIVREVGNLSKNPKLFLTTTHFHPEHAMGEQAFPANTILIRPAVQQEEMDRHGQEFIANSRRRTKSCFKA